MSPKERRTEQILTHAKALRALARVLVSDRSHAEDLVQDTMVLALESAPLDGEGIGGWLRGVLRHKARHQRRSRASRARREHLAARSEILPATVDLVARKAQLATLVDEVLRLDEPYQSVLYLRFFEERSAAEIARELGCPEGTIASQVHRGLELLRSRLDDRAGGDRSVWVGALLPWFSAEWTTVGTPLAGVWMAGAVKLVGAAALLGSLIFYVWDANEPGAEDLALAPDAESLRTAEALPAREEPRVDLPEHEVRAPVVDVLQSPPEEVSVATEAAILQPAGPKAKLEPEAAVVPVVTPAPRTPQGHDAVTVVRSFALVVDLDDISPASENEGLNSLLAAALDSEDWSWSYDQVVDVRDRFEIQFVDSFPEFKRRIEGEWTVDHTTGAAGPSAEKLKGKSPLEDRVLCLSRDGLQDRYAVELQDQREGDLPAWTESLQEDMDLRSFCPPAGVLAGQTWEVPNSAMKPLLFPGGDLHVEFKLPTETGIFPKGGVSLLDGADPGDGVWTMTSRGQEKTHEGTFQSFDTSIELEYDLKDLEPEEPGSLLPIVRGRNLTLEATGTGRWDETWQRVAELELVGVCTLSWTVEIPEAGLLRLDSEFSLKINVENSTE